MLNCEHLNAVAEVVDQTLGVTCPDCDYQAACWQDEHVPESIWNKACKNTEGCKHASRIVKISAFYVELRWCTVVDFNRYVKGGDRYRDPTAPKPAPSAVPPIVIGVTGHRPPKLASPGSVAPHNRNGDGYNAYNPLRVRIREELRTVTQSLLDRAAQLGTRSDRYTNALHCVSCLKQVAWRTCTPWTPESLPTVPVALSGMALGVDTDAVKVWIEMGLSVVAVIPFLGQEARWPKPSRTLYQELLRDWVVGTVYVSKVPPKDDAEAKRMMLARDEWLCCASDELIAVFDGTGGGTAHTFNYWQRLAGPRAVRIDPRDLRAEIEAKAETDGARFRALSKDEQLAALFDGCRPATPDDDVPF